MKTTFRGIIVAVAILMSGAAVNSANAGGVYVNVGESNNGKPSVSVRVTRQPIVAKPQAAKPRPQVQSRPTQAPQVTRKPASPPPVQHQQPSYKPGVRVQVQHHVPQQSPQLESRPVKQGMFFLFFTRS